MSNDTQAVNYRNPRWREKLQCVCHSLRQIKASEIEDFIGYNCCLYILMKNNNTYPKFNTKAKYLISESYTIHKCS